MHTCGLTSVEHAPQTDTHVVPAHSSACSRENDAMDGTSKQPNITDVTSALQLMVRWWVPAELHWAYLTPLYADAFVLRHLCMQTPLYQLPPRAWSRLSPPPTTQGVGANSLMGSWGQWPSQGPGDPASMMVYWQTVQAAAAQAASAANTIIAQQVWLCSITILALRMSCMLCVLCMDTFCTCKLLQRVLQVVALCYFPMALQLATTQCGASVIAIL